jgi:hypothetical protein
MGGFNTLKSELIDDCALARRVKFMGYRTWMGLTRSVTSLRAYDDLSAIWSMVARTAFTQLHYSGLLVVLCTAVMLTAFWVPTLGLLMPSGTVKFLAVVSLIGMVMSYRPTLKFYELSGWWSLAMPLVGTLYLAMTWTSALSYWVGEGSNWKGRAYSQKKSKRK